MKQLFVMIGVLGMMMGAQAVPKMAPRFQAPSVPARDSVDAPSLKILKRAARVYSSAHTLDWRFLIPRSEQNNRALEGRQFLQETRVCSRKPGDFSLSDEENGSLYVATQGRAWNVNSWGFRWQSSAPWDSETGWNLSSGPPDDWVEALLHGQVPLHRGWNSEASLQRVRISVERARLVRGERCDAVRRRLWILDKRGQISSFEDVVALFRRRDGLLWSLHGVAKDDLTSGRKTSNLVFLETVQGRLNGSLDTTTFRFEPKLDSEHSPFQQLSALLRPDTMFPAFSVSDVRQKPQTSGQRRGQVWLMVWEIARGKNGDLPLTEALTRQMPRSVGLLSVVVNGDEYTWHGDKYTWHAPDIWLHNRFPVVLLPNDFGSELATQFGVRRAPLVFVIGRDGRVVGTASDARDAITLLKHALQTPALPSALQAKG